MAVKDKVQLAADIATSTFTVPQKVILDDVVDSYQDLAQQLTTVQRDAIVAPASGQLIYNTDNSQFEYYNGGEWVNMGYGLGVPQTVKVTVSSAELLALATTPKDLIAAQGAGLAIDLNRYSIKLTYGTTPYDFASLISINFESNLTNNYTISQFSTSIFNSPNSVSGSASPSSIGSTDRLKANEKLQLTTSTNPTQGDGVLTLWLTYTTIVL